MRLSSGIRTALHSRDRRMPIGFAEAWKDIGEGSAICHGEQAVYTRRHRRAPITTGQQHGCVAARHVRAKDKRPQRFGTAFLA